MAYLKCLRNVSASSIPDGKTVTPTDDISTWLACGGRSEAYTTLAEVLNDSTCLSALISDSNAIDYLVRSTTWASGITADSGAMTAIGGNNYAANTLLADSTWCNAICNSTYFESVLNVKVPVMTSNTTPSGEVSASSVLSGYDAYKAFNGDAITVQGWTSTEEVNAWIAYDFGYEVKINAINIAPFCQADAGGLRAKDFVLQAYDVNDWVDIYESTIPNASQVTNNYYSFINTTAYNKYRLYVKNNYATNNGYIIINELQFYGREDV